MRQRKHERSQKRQRGQFLTPRQLASDIVRSLDFRSVRRVLEPSCGDGSFVTAVLDRFLERRDARPAGRLDSGGATLVAVDIDQDLVDECRRVVASSLKADSPCGCHVFHGDFFRLFLERPVCHSDGDHPNPLADKFDLIIGNPPFGGSFAPDIEDALDAALGKRCGQKVKKETYAFFIVACTELLRPGGRLVFICSDSLLTIPTMTGLRRYLMESGRVTLHRLEEFSAETSYPMLVLEYTHREGRGTVSRFGETLNHTDMEATPNLSWGVTPEVARLFRGPKLGDYFVASSGMTTGKNDYFVREVAGDNTIEESFRFRFYDARVSVAYELERARLSRLPDKRRRELKEAERRGDTERRVAIERRDAPATIPLPHDDYRPYNKANGRIVYSPPTHVIYWKDDGDAVLTYKRTGNWYLRGVGGQPFFGREGLTWQLVASRFVARYLPSGYILDSGAPCAFARDGVDSSEVFFVLGWLLCPLANQILKTVINHTMNIQSKDFERMPYPWWVSDATKARATQCVMHLIEEAKAGGQWQWADPELKDLAGMYQFDGSSAESAAAGTGRKARKKGLIQKSLF